MWITLMVAITLLAGSCGGGRAGPTPVLPLPASMASAGDSITRAFDVDAGHFLQESPAESWSTGTDPTLGSHYDRILAARPVTAAFNYAETGAKMDALAAQLGPAGAEHVEYVTVLMGDNDMCTPTVATMTPTAAFSAQFDKALGDFFARDPGAHVLVASIPDLFELWNALHTNPFAQAVWSLAHICQSLLSATATPADRDAVAAQELADNSVLQSVCARYPHCRFDGFAVYRARFGPTDISVVDYFHPSVTGQQRLAALTWAAGFWPTR